VLRSACCAALCEWIPVFTGMTNNKNPRNPRNPRFRFVAKLKKQSQFSAGRNELKSILTMVYGDFNEPGRRKNKANSKPIQSQFVRSA